MRLLASATGAALFALAGAVLAASGDLDPSFGLGGRVLTDFNLSTDIAYAVAVQADGKLVVVGTTYTNNDYSNEDFALARYNPDGSLDAGFDSGSIVTTLFPHGNYAFALALQPDGRIVAVGFQAFATPQGAQFALARYLTK
jgi:uncharacterized delta-60 repeat protein